MEETETQKTKVSDSGYSNSCSNSQSQRSSGSSKSRHSTSSGSSGYCPHLTNNNDGEKPSDKEHKKKKDGQNSLQQSSTELEPLPTVSENAMREENTPQHSDVRCHETLQLAALNQTFSTVKRLRSKEQSPDVEISSPREKNITQWSRDEVMQLVNEEMTHEDYMRSKYCSEDCLPTRTRSYGTIAYPFRYHPQEELGIIVSMEDGLVLYITPALTDILCYPKDMWIGRSLIDLIHPKHRASFAGHITSVIANDGGTTRRTPYSCYLRQYRGLRSSGFSVTEKWVGYLPLQLNISFQQTIGEAPKMCLVITAAQITSAYKYGDEIRVSAKFTTRHTASSQLCHVDPEVTPYFGYLPQDILGRSILEFYHPEDLRFLKEVYEAVVKEEGHLFRSKPYRFRCQNGGFALVETELSSFINPWSRKLEFIIGQHTVLRGPSNPDVTTPVAEPEAVSVSEELLKEAKIVHEEIKHLLDNTVVRSCKTAKQQVTKRCKDLAAFMENLMDELTKPPDLRVDVPMEEQSFSERDSVMLGEISPHHEFYDSKSFSGIPPSYNQLNYNENIQRFFESKPKTSLSEESSKSKVGSCEDGKTLPAVEDSKSGESSGAQSSESNKNSGESNASPQKNNPSKKFKPTMLTKQLLSRHNEDMEKRMVQKHREQRSKSDRDLKIKERLRTTLDKPQEESTGHGIKRSSSHSWEGEPSKAIKSVLTTEPALSAMTSAEKQATILPVFPPSQELNPPPFASTLMPMYYLPNKRPDLLIPEQSVLTVPYVGGMVYQPVMFGTQPLVYAPLAVIPSPDRTHPPGSIVHEETMPPAQQMSTDIKHGNNYRHSQSSSPRAQDQKTESSDTSVPFDDSSSSFYPFLKTDKSDDSLQSSSENDTKQEVAPWIEDINITPELILTYQVKDRPMDEVFYQDLQALKSITQEELGIIVSMEDGLVLYITPGLTDVLGYPKDMWIGRSLIDLIHPKHRASFAGHITSVIANDDAGTTRRTPYSCYLRQYRGLRSSGFSVTEKWVGYLPLQLNISFQQTIGEAPKMCLVITAAQITSAYKYGDETRASAKFTTRHTASSQLCHIDPEVTPYFGYLPQDILGRSILEFYHPEDLCFLKEVYEAAIKEEGRLFRSKPYRFRCQNGGFALVETELSSFINPWSRKLEFIIGQHTVLRGPSNPDVTTPVAEPEAVSVSEELLKEAKIVHEEIKHLLNNTVVRSCKTPKQQVTKRCKDLAAFMENLMDELTKPPDLRVDVPMEEQSFSERDSVMLGEISPHHEFYDSKSSSGTPPSYNQLNYNENIQRFFESKPKTTISEESSESKVSSSEEGKTSPVAESKSEESSGAQSSESNKNSGESNVSPPKNNPSKKFKPTMLTKQLLSRHNEDMEKRMVQKHREQRSKSDRDLKIKERLKTTLDKTQEESTSHGIKRSSSHSWEGEPSKVIKSVLLSPEKQATILPALSPSQKLNPPPFASTLMPMYYLPNKRPDLLFPQQIPYVGGMVYQPVMFGTQPLIYAPLAVIPSPDLTCSPGSGAHGETTTSLPQMSTDIKHGNNNYRPSKCSSSSAQDQKTESNDTSVPFDDSSSSFYSFLKTDKSDESLQSSSENDTKPEEADWRGGKDGDGKKVAPWLEDINITQDLILKYQVKERPIEEVLYQDLQALKSITQPELVSEQLSQMYLDLELEGLSKQLTLEEASSSSESSGDEAMVSSWQKNNMEYDRMVILFEEDAPLPSPLAQGY